MIQHEAQNSPQALRDVPEVNSAWMGDFIRQYDDVHVSVAVQTPHGLMVPVIRNTDRLGLSDINAEVKMLASKVAPYRPRPPRLSDVYAFDAVLCAYAL